MGSSMLLTLIMLMAACAPDERMRAKASAPPAVRRLRRVRQYGRDQTKEP